MPLVEVLADLERAGVKVDTRAPRRHEPRHGGAAGGPHQGDPPPRQGRVQHQLPGAAPRGALRPAGAAEREEDGQDEGRLDRGGRPRGAGPRPRAAAEDPRVPLRPEAQVHLRRRPAGARPPRDRPHPRHLQPDGGGHRPALRHRPQPPEHPHPHRRGPADPRGLRRRARAPPPLRRLLPDRAARPRPPLEGPDPHRHLPPGRGRPRPHVARDLRPPLADPASSSSAASPRWSTTPSSTGRPPSAWPRTSASRARRRRASSRPTSPATRRCAASSTTRSRRPARPATCGRSSGACGGSPTCARRASRSAWRPSGRP